MQIGIDLGATKIESIVLDDKGEELLREREESPHNYQETLNFEVSRLRVLAILLIS